MTSDKERIALFIDGPNLYATAKSLGFDIDFRRLLEEFQSRGILERAFYSQRSLKIRILLRSVP